MTRFQRTCVLTGLVLCLLGLGLPQTSYAITGCTNAYLTGTYNAQVSSANLMSVLNALNGNTGTSSTGSGSGAGGSTGSAGSTMPPNNGFFGPGTPSTAVPPGSSSAAAGGTTGAAASNGFSNNPFSLNGMLPATSRFFFDGNGNIVGNAPGIGGPAGTQVNAGTYTVNADCSASIKLVTGQTFNAVVTGNGSQVLFIENDSSGPGLVGSLQRSTNVCLNPGAFPESFGFSFFGAQQTTAAASGSGGSTGAAAAATFAPTAAIGSIQLNPDSTFSLTQWTFQNNSVQSAKSTGTFSIGADCSLSLTFPTGAGGVTGSLGGLTSPISFRGSLINSTSGLVTVQPNSDTTFTGQFIAQ